MNVVTHINFFTVLRIGRYGVDGLAFSHNLIDGSTVPWKGTLAFFSGKRRDGGGEKEGNP